MPAKKSKTAAKRSRSPVPAAGSGRMMVPVRRAANVRARYDAATITDENRRHFAVADGLSPDALANPEIRRRLRNWTRYEVRNNSYAKGIRDTIANDCVGTGPQLQMQTGVAEVDDAIEQDFADWAKEIRLAEKLRTMRAARADSGEVVGLMVTNPGLVSDVKLDLRLAEAEQLIAPTVEFDDPVTESDGIRYDAWGNPTAYFILRIHPGSNLITDTDEGDWWPARSILHYYRPDRPGQRRGVPDFTPAVQLFAELRRYCAAVIAAAETAADWAAVLYSDAPPDPEGATTEVEALDTVELARRMATTLPQGWKLGQMEAEQPTTTYAEFVDKKLSEICRCLQVPFTIGALDSSKSNLSAAYLDHQTYAKAVGIDRDDLGVHLDRLLDAWLTEWLLLQRGRINPAAELRRFPHQWFWPSLGNHADPAKVATARATDLAAGMTTIPREYARQGLDWVAEQDSAAKALGVTVDQYRELVRNKTFKVAGADGGGTGGTSSSTEPSDEKQTQEQD